MDRVRYLLREYRTANQLWLLLGILIAVGAVFGVLFARLDFLLVLPLLLFPYQAFLVVAKAGPFLFGKTSRPAMWKAITKAMVISAIAFGFYLSIWSVAAVESRGRNEWFPPAAGAFCVHFVLAAANVCLTERPDNPLPSAAEKAVVAICCLVSLAALASPFYIF